MRRYYGIEFLRLITSVSVILYHYRLFFKPYNIYSPAYFAEEKIRLPFYSLLDVFYNYGIYGVHVFYAISGFVFAHVYLSLNNKVSSKDILKLMKDKQVEFVDLRFTDPKGKLQHLTMDSTVVDEEMLNKGVFLTDHL